MKKDYISIKDACDVSKKSISTIRRFVDETKVKAPSMLNYEILKNGTKKILINAEYLNKYFNLIDTSQTTQTSESNSELVSVLKSALDTLKIELDAKNNHINMLLERQRETNIMIEGLNQRFMIEAKDVSVAGTNKKKKWWKFGK